MGSNDKYVRVKPYNKHTGCLAMRVNIDGKLFESGNWYVVPAEVAKKLSKMFQKTGAPFFEVCSYDEFREASQRDLAAMALAAGLKGLALAPQQLPQPRAHVDKKEKKSELAGIGKQIKDVDLSGDGVMTTAQLRGQESSVDEEESETDEVKSVNVSSMKRPELEALCKEYNITVPFGSSNAEIKQLLRDQGIVE